MECKREHCTLNTPRDVPSVMGEGTSLFPSGSDAAGAHAQLPATNTLYFDLIFKPLSSNSSICCCLKSDRLNSIIF